MDKLFPVKSMIGKNSRVYVKELKFISKSTPLFKLFEAEYFHIITVSWEKMQIIKVSESHSGTGKIANDESDRLSFWYSDCTGK